MAKRYATPDEVTSPVGGVARELRDVPADQVELWLEIAREFIGLDAWGTRASKGHALLAAHFLTLHVGGPNGTGTADGPVQSISLGPASRSFATSVDVSDKDLMTTRYGRAFTVLRNVTTGSRPSALVVNSKIRQ